MPKTAERKVSKVYGFDPRKYGLILIFQTEKDFQSAIKANAGLERIPYESFLDTTENSIILAGIKDN